MTETLTVLELNARISGAIRGAFAEQVWVTGEIQGFRPGTGHLYFRLVEPGELGGPAPATIGVALFRTARRGVERQLAEAGGLALADGLAVRIRAEVDFYPPQGRIQLIMSAIDPGHTLGRLAVDRERLLRTLAAEGLLGRNAALALPAVPLRIALVTSAGSAAAHDVLAELRASGLGFQVMLIDARVQGAEAIDSILAGLAHAARADVDVVALVRGGGSRTDLVAFDAEPVARAVAAMPLPVLAGIGHEIDASVVDEVAHRAFKTPTAVAAFLVDRVRTHLDAIEAAWARIARRGTELLGREEATVRSLATRVAGGARATVGVERARVGELSGRVRDGAGRSLRAQDLRLGALEAQVRALDPTRVLARGWSVTRTEAGDLVRRTDDAPPGTHLVTLVTDGRIHSTTDATEAP